MSARRGLALTLALVAVPAASAQAADQFTIRATSKGVQAIGRFQPTVDSSPTAAAVAFGQPTSRKKLGDDSCRLGWRSIGLRITFADFGGGDDPCGRDGKAQIASAFGRGWNTSRGLRVGSSTKTLRKLYRGAKRRGSTYRLISANSLEGGSFARLGASTRRGKVTAFSLFVGGAGD